MRSLKSVLLGMYLILAGLMLLEVNIGGEILAIVAGICAIVAGLLFMTNR